MNIVRNRLPSNAMNGTWMKVRRTLKGRRRFLSRLKRNWLLATTAVIVAAVCLASLASSQSAVDPQEQPRVLTVQATSVEPVRSYESAREYTGVVVARRTSNLGFELAGKLTELAVDEGDSVAAGAVLAQLNTERLETNRRRILAQRAQAAAQLDEMLAGPRDEDIAAARARVESLQAQVELLQRQTTRHEKLLGSGAATRNEYEENAFGLRARQAELDEARHNLQKLLNGTRKEQIEAQRAVVAELEAAIADIDVDLRKSKLTAPFDGTVARRLADEGTVVEAGHPVFRLVEDQALEAWIGLPARATSQLTQGSTQQVQIHGEYFNATVAGQFPEVDPATRTRTVVLKLDATTAEHVAVGQMVRLGLEETIEARGFWLPTTALTRGSHGLWSALVLEETDAASESLPPDSLRVARRDVEVVHTKSDRVLVRGPLNPGDRVIETGTHRVVPGQLVRLSKRESRRSP